MAAGQGDVQGVQSWRNVAFHALPTTLTGGDYASNPMQAHIKDASQRLNLAVLVPLVGSDQVQKHLMQELKTWLPASVTLVHLPQTADAGIQATPDYLIRSQPDTACMSTMEAIARCDCHCFDAFLHLVQFTPHPCWVLMYGDAEYICQP